MEWDLESLKKKLLNQLVGDTSVAEKFAGSLQGMRQPAALNKQMAGSLAKLRGLPESTPSPMPSAMTPPALTVPPTAPPMQQAGPKITPIEQKPGQVLLVDQGPLTTHKGPSRITGPLVRPIIEMLKSRYNITDEQVAELEAGGIPPDILTDAEILDLMSSEGQKKRKTAEEELRARLEKGITGDREEAAFRKIAYGLASAINPAYAERGAELSRSDSEKLASKRAEIEKLIQASSNKDKDRLTALLKARMQPNVVSTDKGQIVVPARNIGSSTRSPAERLMSAFSKDADKIVKAIVSADTADAMLKGDPSKMAWESVKRQIIVASGDARPSDMDVRAFGNASLQEKAQDLWNSLMESKPSEKSVKIARELLSIMKAAQKRQLELMTDDWSNSADAVYGITPEDASSMLKKRYGRYFKKQMVGAPEKTLKQLFLERQKSKGK